MNKPAFIESIKVKDGEFYHLPLHIERMQTTITHFYGITPNFSLDTIEVPNSFQKGIVKCRIVYDDKIKSVEFSPYIFRSFHSIRLIEDNEIDYRFKRLNRERLNQLYNNRGDADEILIIKEGKITDTSFSNVVFENEEGFFTPATCLLNGVKRRQLLSEGVIQEREMTVDDITSYHTLYFINAMIDLADRVKVSTEKIVL